MFSLMLTSLDLGAMLAQGDDFKSAKPVAFHLELQLKHKQATLRFI